MKKKLHKVLGPHYKKQLFAPKSTFTERKAKRAIKKLNIYFPVQDNDKDSMKKKLHKILGFQHKNNSLHQKAPLLNVKQ